MNPEDLLRELKDPDRWINVRVPRATRASATAVAGSGRTRFVPLVAAFTIAIVAVAAIALGLGSLHRPTAPPAATQHSTASPSTSSSPAPPITIVPGAVHRYSGTVLPPECTLKQLDTESKQDGGGAAGTYIQAVYVHNTGADCLLAADAVLVGGTAAKLVGRTSTHGVILPSQGSASLEVSAAFVCNPSGATNVTSERPVQPITLRTGGGQRTMPAQFPNTACESSSVSVEIDPTYGTFFPSQIAALLPAATDAPAASGPGRVDYSAILQVRGSKALVLSQCPTATEVVTDGAQVRTRLLRLVCTPGLTLEPGIPITIDLATTVPDKGAWAIAWFLSDGTAHTLASTTCTLKQLTITDQQPLQGFTGNIGQVLAVRNSGSTCTLPFTAFSIGGRGAHVRLAKYAHGFRVPGGASTDLIIGASNLCDGGRNYTSMTIGRDAKPIAVTLGGHTRFLSEFPALHCQGPFVEPQ